MRIKWALWLLPFFLIACSLEKENGAPVPQTADPTPEVVIIGPTGGYPEGCQPDEVAELVMAFFDAYNTGDTAVLDQSFAEPIQWYSDGIEEKEQNHFTTYDRDGMFPYFAARQEQHDQLKLFWLSVNPRTWHGGVGITYRLWREADDLEPGQDGRSRLAIGKGAVRCPEGKIFIWSMATLSVWESAANYFPGGCHSGSVADAAGKIIVCANGIQE